ncbi:MAG: DUF4258 domain-containing protein [Prevotellaceae bacterium]|jgi:hypothetical protein|nr:DUF4258 domain-containing protein [Prevotellaceae bacterium]
MDFIFSKHAEEQMLRRAINREVAVSVILFPDQKIIDNDNPEIVIFQSLIEENRQMFLLRVVINIIQYPNIVITLYKTTKINKYYK